MKRSSSTATKKKPRWTQVSASTKPDPRVPVEDPEYGKRIIHVVMLIDDDGQLWEKVENDQPKLVGRPPAA